VQEEVSKRELHSGTTPLLYEGTDCPRVRESQEAAGRW
jgi:hypothetical protein